ncbi:MULTISPECIES: peptide MFS transporter [unclassified Micromonospora]|uniref:peptide MFS transporter n=1 Tax=unclassified Micromonospora TaxID=2617518 RepID=UPI003A87FDD4
MSAATAARPAPSGPARASGYFTLFMTDSWERFGFYALQAILVLFAVAPLERGGLGLPVGDATAMFGAWMGLTFMLALPGGWVGDRVLGLRRAILAGGVIIALGHFSLALPTVWTVPLGLVLLSVGTGLFKPNHQAMLNTVLGGDAGRRESGISLMYVGIQISALVAPLISGFLGERVNWRLGFAVAGLAMAIGVVQFATARPRFNGLADRPGRPLAAADRRRALRQTSATLGVLTAVVVVAALTGVLTPTTAIISIGMLSLIVPVIAFIALHRHPALTGEDRGRLRSFLWVFLGSALFWMLVGQGGSVLNLFARDQTNRDVGGFLVPASWLQSATPLFILLLAPVLAWLLPRAGMLVGLPGKFAVGLLMAGASFLLMAVAAILAADGRLVSPGWLMVVYLMHACGELIVAAVGISAAADVLPPAFIAHTLGLLWLFAALGGGLGSQVVRLAEVMPLPAYFGVLGAVSTIAGLAFMARRRSIGNRLAPRTAQFEAAH